MKKIGIYSLFMLLLMIASCGQKPMEKLVGEWKLTDISSTAEVSEDLKDAHQEIISEMKETYLLVLNADSTFVHTLLEGTSNGKWKISDDLKSLTLSYENGNVEVSKIVELSNNKMVTSVEFNEAENILTLEKQAK
jgi:hypothetical protein